MIFIMTATRKTPGRTNPAAGSRAVLFDFGGVIAEEGFREGLEAIAKKRGLNPTSFFSAADELIHDDGYVTGRTKEASYWRELKKKTGISGNDGELRREILSRFVLRPVMLRWVTRLQDEGFIVGLLSDQTNWLEELDRQHHFYERFDYIFNSFRMGTSKRDPKIFAFVCKVMALRPHQVLFVDDNEANIIRAAQQGMKTILFTDVADFENRMGAFLPPKTTRP